MTLDLTGRRFGRLIALRSEGQKYGRRAWLCRCDCGKETTVYTGHLTLGRTKSCGCGLEDRKALLAVAPDMLAAIKDLLDWAEYHCGLSGNDEAYGHENDEELVRARAVIARSKGQS